MITAANRTTNKAQEILGTSAGALLVSPEECQVGFFSTSGTLTLTGCRLVGVLLTSGSDAASILVEVDSNRALWLKVINGWSRSAFFPLPLSCRGRVDITLTGTGPEAYVYYTDLT